MHKSDTSPSRRWFGLRPAAERLPQDDPADLGTAFGLDLSLGETPDDALPGVASPMDGPDGWMQRLCTRRRPAY